jgi:hypothetical protein
VALAGPAAAAALTTIGQLAPGTPPSMCSAQTDALAQTVTSGNSYVVPAGGAEINSWSTNAGPGAGQSETMKIFRKVAEPVTYKVVGHDGPRPLTPSTLNTFSANLAVQPGDVLGLNDGPNVSTAHDACFFSVTGETDLAEPGDLADNASTAFNGSDPGRPNVSAVVAIKPSNNSFTFGKVKDNKKKGTATLAVNVPGPGTLSLTGKGVKAQRPAREATQSSTVTAAGTVKLLVKPQGKAKKRLNKKGKVKVAVSVTYTPTGDVPGDPNTQTDKVKLVKKH